MKKQFLSTMALGILMFSSSSYSWDGGVKWGDSPGVCLPVSVWIDPGIAIATGLDYMATKEVMERHIDASDAIEQLEEAIGGDGSGGGGGSGSGGTSEDASAAAVYAPEDVVAVIQMGSVSAKELFTKMRSTIGEYLFETTSPDINGECALSDRDCAVERQKEWLLASLTMASATADKVLERTSKVGEDQQTEAEKSDDEKEGKDTNKKTSGGGTSLAGQLNSLASNFNSQTTPMGMYNALADIVLDTHRHVNDANALMGRDLEAQGLRATYESGVVSLAVEKNEEE